MTGLFIALLIFTGGQKQAARFAISTDSISQPKTIETPYQAGYSRENSDYITDEELLRRKLRDDRIRKYRQRAGKWDSAAISKTVAKTPAIRMVSAKSLLARKIDMSIFNQDMSLEEALDAIQKAGLPLIIMWNDLENNAYVNPDTAIGFEGNGIATTKLALELVLKSVDQGASPIKYVIAGGAVTVATANLKVARKTMKVYDISVLANMPWQNNQGNGRNGRGNSGYGQGNSGFGQSGQGIFGASGFQGNNNSYGSGQRNR